MEKKNFARTIRMKESIRQYVEQQPGNTFSEKFENMVRFTIEHEKQIQQSISQLKQQQRREKEKLEKMMEVKTILSNVKFRVEQAYQETEQMLCKND